MRRLLPVALFVLTVAVPSAMADPCKQAGPLPQSKCIKDSQCCPGLVCQAAGPSKNNATTQCLPGCRIGGAFQTPGQKNTAPNNCQSCQPSRSTTAWSNLAAGTPCRAAAGVCDVAESCTGTSGACPADGFASAATSCTGASQGGACDGADHCSGTSNACVDVFLPSTTVCRAAAGVCDVAESCTGTSGACPADAYAPTGTECRQSTGVCDPAEDCTGTNVDCPPDEFLMDGTPCDDPPCAVGGTCMSGACVTTSTTTTTTMLQSPPMAVTDQFVAAEDASGTILLGNKLANDSDVDGDTLVVTDVSLGATPITLVGAGGLAIADVSIVKLTGADPNYVAGSVATFRITTADNGDAGTDPQTAFIYINANGNEFLINNTDAFGAMDFGQSLQFNFSYSISDGHGGTSTAQQRVTIAGVSPT